LRSGGRQPVRVRVLLILEGPVLERGQDVGELEAADGRSGNRVVRRCEDSVKDLLVLRRSAIDRIGSLDKSGRRLNLVEVEGEVTRNRAVESRLEEGRPLVVELVSAALVVLADASNTRVNAL
jgi:hypothetical protein